MFIYSYYDTNEVLDLSCLSGFLLSCARTFTWLGFRVFPCVRTPNISKELIYDNE
jgi:hypothetical protein